MSVFAEAFVVFCSEKGVNVSVNPTACSLANELSITSC